MNTQRIVQKLLPLKPEKIILFGSYAKGTPSRESDVDILVIQRTKERPATRVAKALKLVWGSEPHVEPYVLTPEEFQVAVLQNRFFITQEVLLHGKVIYEKN